MTQSLKVQAVIVLLTGSVLFVASARAQSLGASELSQAGDRAFRLGQYAEAERSFRLALAQLESTNADVDAWASALGSLAKTLLADGQFQEAERHLNNALTRLGNSETANPQLLSSLLGSLGSAYQETGRHQQAKARFEAALRVGERNPAVDPALVAILSTNLAVTDVHFGKSKEAEKRFKSAIALLEQLEGQESLSLIAL